jgi:hypothetical protein
MVAYSNKQRSKPSLVNIRQYKGELIMQTKQREAILNNLGLKKDTNINNNNYNNYNNDNNNILTTKIFVDDKEVVEETSSLSLGEDLVCHLEGGIVLPAAWRSAKLDLFQNGIRRNGTPNLKLKLGVVKQDQYTQSLVANLNSPTHMITRGVEDTQTQHWRTVLKHLAVLKNIFQDVRASKFVLPGNKGTLEDCVFLFQDAQDNWHCHIKRTPENQILEFVLDGEVTPAQRKGNIIATGNWGANNKRKRKFITAEELGI